MTNSSVEEQKFLSKTANFLIGIVRSEGALVVFIPFVGTFASLIFESGRCFFYGVPFSFIQIDLVKIISSIMVLFIFTNIFNIIKTASTVLVYGPREMKIFFLVVLGLLFIALVAASMLSIIGWVFWIEILIFLLMLSDKFISRLF